MNRMNCMLHCDLHLHYSTASKGHDTLVDRLQYDLICDVTSKMQYSPTQTRHTAVRLPPTVLLTNCILTAEEATDATRTVCYGFSTVVAYAKDTYVLRDTPNLLKLKSMGARHG